MAQRVRIVVHGGAGNSRDNLDGCIHAAESGFQMLLGGAQALDAALAAGILLEDDERFNAGTGSSLGLDGETIAMDAAVMDTQGRLGAVAGLQDVKNPLLVARAVADTPHWLLAGDGAIRFARQLGIPAYHTVTPKAVAQHREVVTAIQAKSGLDFSPRWLTFDVLKHWNFRRAWQDVIRQHGASTIGAVALDREGHLAIASSTGGASPMLYGRVGDTPIVGCGFYAGPAGALAATGIGEEIVKQILCHTVYSWLEQGTPLQTALDRGVALFPPSVDIGLIGVTRQAAAFSSNRPMPAYALEG